MSNLTAKQKQVRNHILAIAHEMMASPMLTKSALETGLVESNLTNIKGGDADSSGWRQERASLYKDPNNLDASIRRYFKEGMAVQHKYKRAGDLAAAVQRPAAQYRGRYQERSAEADALMQGTSSAVPTKGRAADVHTATKLIPGKTTQDTDAAVMDILAAHKGGSKLKQLDSLLSSGAYDTTTPDRSVTTTSKTAAGGASAPSVSSKKGSPLLEMFWQGAGGINVKNGKKVAQGFVDGHTDHVHVAAGPKTVVQLGKLAQSMGLRVGENSHFNGGKHVSSGHAADSYHYKDEAIDVSGDPKKMAHYAATVAHKYGIKVKG